MTVLYSQTLMNVLIDTGGTFGSPASTKVAGSSFNVHADAGNDFITVGSLSVILSDCYGTFNLKHSLEYGTEDGLKYLKHAVEIEAISGNVGFSSLQTRWALSELEIGPANLWTDPSEAGNTLDDHVLVSGQKLTGCWKIYEPAA